MVGLCFFNLEVLMFGVFGIEIFSVGGYVVLMFL